MTHCYQRLKRMGSVGLLLLAFGCAGFTTQDEMPELEEFYKLYHCDRPEEEQCFDDASIYLSELNPEKQLDISKILIRSKDADLRCLGFYQITALKDAKPHLPEHAATLISQGGEECFSGLFLRHYPTSINTWELYKELFEEISKNFREYTEEQLQNIESFSKPFLTNSKIQTPFSQKALEELVIQFQSRESNP